MELHIRTVKLQLAITFSYLGSLCWLAASNMVQGAAERDPDISQLRWMMSALILGLQCNEVEKQAAMPF